MAEEKTHKILIIDDDEFLLDMYALKFKERGAQVEAFQSGAAALTHIRDGYVPDALIVDIVMPEMDGFEILKTIKQEGLIKPVIIVLSNQGQDSDIERAKELGAHGYIIKANAVPSEVIEESLLILKEHGL